MSESEVSQIRDEDVLRRMWQQTEDFSRKKEIRSHMYRLREERLRNLYSPEPTPDGKGCEFTSTQGHVKSFADQTFQSMKSKEVRDAGSPPKEFVYRGQDLKELSNAGWNVESEDRTTDDGRTHVKSVNANIEGRYDVEGGRGQFAAADRQRQAVTEHHDDTSSMRRDESSSDTAAREHVVQHTADGTRVSSTTSSSNTSSKIQQVSSTKHETVPYLTDDDYDLARRTAHDTNRNEQVTRTTNRNDYEQTLRKNDFSNAELVSRKVEYPDDNTKVIVETRCLPDGTRVTSTRREFRVPAQSTRSEYQTKSESKSYSSQHKSDIRDSASKITRHSIDSRSDDIVDSQRNVDDYDFKRQLREYTSNEKDDISDTQRRHITNVNKKVSDYSQTEDDYSQQRYETRVNSKVIDHSTTNKEDHTQIQRRTIDRRNDNQVDESDRQQTSTTRDHDNQHKVFKETRHFSDTEENIRNVTRDRKDNEEKVTYISSNRTMSEDGVRDAPRDGKIPVDKSRDRPREDMVPGGKTHDVPRSGTVPVDTTRDTPRDETVPAERYRDTPRDGKALEGRIGHVPVDKTITDEKVQHIKRDQRVEEVVERKTISDHYQTTYQNDYQTRKISTDWSPTHQAWASTLRSDTPSATRPSTRASSPGSRTFKSSTSSLRSSVSPDKTTRKPSSRGGSPNKMDRYSPTRTVTSDRYSSTHSTHSTTDVTNKNKSPERKPPTGRSPNAPTCSPERTTKDVIHQRPSVSPEKRPKHIFERPNISPERKPSPQSSPTDRIYPRTPIGKKETSKSPTRPKQSPERKPTGQPSNDSLSDIHRQTSPYRSTSSPDRKPTDDYPNRSSPRSSSSPDKKTGIQKPTNTPAAGYPTTSLPSQFHPTDEAPRKSETSPDRKPGYHQPSTQLRQSPEKPIDKYEDSPTKRPSKSPDRKPSYMRPTATSSQPNDKATRPSRAKDEPDRKSPSKQVPVQSPNRIPQDFDNITKYKEDHYRFVDEETKIYTRTDNTDNNKTVIETSVLDESRPRDKSPSPMNKISSEDSPDFCKAPFSKDKSPSPTKNSVIITENDELYGRIEKPVENINIYTQKNKKIENITTEKQTPTNKIHPIAKDTPSRETSPSKYGTYEKKKPREVGGNMTEVTTETTGNTRDIKYDSLNRRDKNSPKNVPDVPSSTKKSPRDSYSPVKSSTKDTKYKHMTDFIAIEKTTEEINKKTTVKDHPRQLFTPSSSPTRKPKTIETEPSTGQSSPTTSASGFVYFGSPRTEKPMVTDLDEFFPDSETPKETSIKPESLDVKRSPSPSKIPCRSPSPEKYVPTTKESLPRKSSLKKPSTDVNQASPVEKPPTSFRVSPTDDKPDVFEVVKKDQLSKPDTSEPETGEPDSTFRPKPPLQRRETYEDRCKKILGMVEDKINTKESFTSETKTYTNKPDSGQNSPSVSPCDSPTLKDSPFPEYPTRKQTTTNKTKVDVTDFITHEQDLTKTTIARDEKKSKIPSRESSPTKQQKIRIDKRTTDDAEEETVTKFSKNYDAPKNTSTKRPSESPERKPTSSPSKSSRPIDSSPLRSKLSPDRKLVDEYPKNISPPKTSSSDTPDYGKTTTLVTSTLDETSNDDMQETTNFTNKITEKHQTRRVLESPTREIPKSSKSLPEHSDQPGITSPSRQLPRQDGSPSRKPHSQDQKSAPIHPKDDTKPDDITRSRPRESPKRTSDYTKSTTVISSQYDSSCTTEDADDSYTDKILEKKEPHIRATSSPSRRTPLDSTRTRAPVKPSQSSEILSKTPDSSPERKPARDAGTRKLTSEGPIESQSSKPREVPGYMKTTTAAATKFDSVLVSEKTQEITKSKTIEKKHMSLNSQPKSTPEYRTPSPIKPNRPLDISPDRKPPRTQPPSSPSKESPTKKPVTEHPSESSPSRKSPEKIPGYMQTTASISSKYESTEYDGKTTKNVQETVTSSTTDKTYPVPRSSESPTRQTPKLNDKSAPGSIRKTSPSRSSHSTRELSEKQGLSPERKPHYQQPSKDSPKEKPRDLSPKSSKEIPGYMKTTTSVTSKFDITSTTKDIDENIALKKVHQKYATETPTYNSKIGDRPRTLSSIKPTVESPRKSVTSPDQKPNLNSPVKDSSLPDSKHLKHTTPERPSASPERPSYMKPTISMSSKIDTTITTHEIQDDYFDDKTTSTRTSVSPSRKSPECESKENLAKPEEPRQLRTPSPTKKITKVTEASTDFIISEREQEILSKVQKSLRKLSPERKERSPSREKSPTKTTTSLQDLDIMTKEIVQTETIKTENLSGIVEEKTFTTTKGTRPEQLSKDKPNEQKTSNKPSSRNVSPIKKTLSSTSNTVDRTPDSPTKSRSFSPKKPVSHLERPQSPQLPKVSGIKPREQIPAHLTRKPTPTSLSSTKNEKLTTDVKKTNGVTRQSTLTKTTTSKMTSKFINSPTSKNSEHEFKRTPIAKSTKDNVSPKKDAVTRTASDFAIKPKKTSSPQRMKSKPEIQVSDMSTKSSKYQRTMIKEPHSKLPSKPKSATALNTSTNEDDVIIDVQQSKSSRENSPDRICPTPINFDDDVGIPRFPDEVSEPDDELGKRTHHTILETESVVDDIVEICEDEELFIKKSEMDSITQYDDSLLSVNDKVNKFTSKIHSIKKPKDTTTTFKDTERRVHSDYIDENLKSDECLLTVSEKVDKFAKGPRDTKESRSPSRRITDEYDKDTVYQDDYTKLSVNDKAHLFVETAENVKTTKVKPVQKVERPDLSHVDESLKSDDCLLSVSDKVNKFVKTAEQYFTETQEDENTEKKIKEQHEKILKNIVNDEETCDKKDRTYTQETDGKPIGGIEEKLNPGAKEPKTSQPRMKDYNSPNSKPTDRVPVVKITTLRSSEAVKKAKALFENIASTQKTTQKDKTQIGKTTKLTDIGVIKKSPKTDSTTVLHPSVEDVSPHVTDVESDVAVGPKTKERPSNVMVTKPQYHGIDEKPQNSPNRLRAQSPEVVRSKSPLRQSIEVTSTKTVLSRYPAPTRAESPRQLPESPRQHTESPRQQLESPRQRTESPRQRTESPRQHPESPSQRTESPRQHPESRRQRTESPRQRTESPRQHPESDKPEKVPGYLRPTKTSQIKEETKIIEDAEVSSRRGSGKFGVELRKTSIERSTISNERRRSVEHHQPCIEDIFDLDLLEQMLEKVVGYEQRRRIRAQIRVAKNQSEHVVDTNTYTRTTKQTTTTSKTRSPERKVTKSPERSPKSAPQKISSESFNKSTPHKDVPDRTQSKETTMNGYTKEPAGTATITRQRPQSPDKPAPKSTLTPRTPNQQVRQPSPDKRRTTSPTKTTPKTKGNRFNEYASAYMKKVGLNESDKVKFTDTIPKKTIDAKQTVKHEKHRETVQEFTTTKSFIERTSSKDIIEIVQTNGKRSPSPEQRQSPERKVQFPEHKTKVPDHKAHSPVRKAQSPERKPQSPERRVYSPEQKAQSPERRVYSPERKAQSPERLHQRTPSPDFKRPKADIVKETIVKTIHDIEKKVPSKPAQEEKPSWVTNRNLKKVTSEKRTYSSKKIENEKPKYRAPSPSKVIAKPIDVITSSYGPGPLDADGKPLFGIKALRNGASNFQVKGTVIRQEFHSRNGGEPEGTVSVTAYSSQPEELEQLLASQGEEPPSRIHGLAAITTTKKFGGDTGNTLSNVHTKEDRASLEHFTHHDRRVENLESRSYDTRSQEFSGDTRREEISASTRRTETKKDSRQTEKNERSTRREVKVTEVKGGQKQEERREKMEKREDKKTVRQSSVKSLTEKYIKSANDSGKGDRIAYPKAGLILRTTTLRDSVSSDDAPPAGLTRSDSEHSLCSGDDTVVTTTERSGDGVRTTTTRTTHHHHPAGATHTTHTRGSTVVTRHEPVVTTKKTTVITQEPVITHRVISHEPVVTHRVVSHEPVVTHRVVSHDPVTHESTVTTERSFLDSSTKVTGVQDILTRMKNADIVIEEGDTTEDSEARALLNKFLGATVLMAGMQGYVADQPAGNLTLHQETTRSSSSGGKVTSRTVEHLDLDQCWDERLLKKLLDECTDYEQRRRLRARIRTLMAEQEACASAVTEALGAEAEAEAEAESGPPREAREEEEVTVTSSVRRDSSDKTVSSSTTTKTSKVIEMTRPAPKPVSPFAKFRQLEKQNSTNSPNSAKSPQSPGSPPQPYFKFTDPALQSSALTIKERLLQWCRDKTRDYENVKLENFSTSWADGLAFCALVHHFLPDAFDYSQLTADRRRHNFTLAFTVADEKAGIYPLLDVEDMVSMRRPDWKCVFTYVQAIYRRFKDDQ